MWTYVVYLNPLYGMTPEKNFEQKLGPKILAFSYVSAAGVEYVDPSTISMRATTSRYAYYRCR